MNIKREDHMNQPARDFFVEYERANSGSNVAAIGALYADTFMFGGPDGVQAVKKEDFLRVLPKMKARSSSMGVSGTELQTVDASTLDSKYLLARVVWRMKLRDPFENKRVDVAATYILARGPADALSIIFQIDHQDLAKVIESELNNQE
jgi:hypothetical protein